MFGQSMCDPKGILLSNRSEFQMHVFLFFTVKLSSTHLTLTLSSLIINLLQSYHQFFHSHVDKVSSSLLSSTQLDHTSREYESFSKSVAVSLLAFRLAEKHCRCFISSSAASFRSVIYLRLWERTVVQKNWSCHL